MKHWQATALLAALAGAGAWVMWPGPRRTALRKPFYGRNYAHRGLFGADQCPPENSLPALADAARCGYGIELDVQFTSDRRLVVFHDDTLDRMTEGHGLVCKTPWAQIKTLHLAGSGQHPPLFAEVLRAVAQADLATPLIVEIKSRRAFSNAYLAQLCSVTLAQLKNYPGPYCIESFDPRVVQIIRRMAPGVMRGQLADSYAAWRKEGLHPVPAWLLSHCCGNWAARPDFIAWCARPRNAAIRLCAAAGAMTVVWTALPHHDTARLERQNDAVIFQWYTPRPRYK